MYAFQFTRNPSPPPLFLTPLSSHPFHKATPLIKTVQISGIFFTRATFNNRNFCELCTEFATPSGRTYVIGIIGKIVLLTRTECMSSLQVYHLMTTIVPPFFFFSTRFFSDTPPLKRETLSRRVNRVHVLLERIWRKIRISRQTLTTRTEIPGARLCEKRVTLHRIHMADLL